MILRYSSIHEELVFSIRYLSLSLKYIEHAGEIILETTENIFTGVREVLIELQRICKCDPHDLALINENIIKEIKKIDNTPLKSYFKTFFNKKVPKCEHNKPSQIPIDQYANEISLSIADIYLFAKTYRALLEGIKLEKREKDWFHQFQTALSLKMSFVKIEEHDLEYLDLKIGKIVNIVDHENADTLFVETVCFGDEKRTIVSGLRSYYQSDDLLDKYCVFITNLKKSKLKGIESQGMILCAKSGDVVEVIESPLNEDGLVLNHKKEGIFVIKNYKKGIIDGKGEHFNNIISKLKIYNHVLTFDGQSVTVKNKEIKTKIKQGDVS